MTLLCNFPPNIRKNWSTLFIGSKLKRLNLGTEWHWKWQKAQRSFHIHHFSSLGWIQSPRQGGYVFACVRQCVCWFVGRITQKTTQQISTKLHKMEDESRPRIDRLNVSCGSIILSHFLKHCETGWSLTFSHIFSGNAWMQGPWLKQIGWI